MATIPSNYSLILWRRIKSATINAHTARVHMSYCIVQLSLKQFQVFDSTDAIPS